MQTNKGSTIYAGCHILQWKKVLVTGHTGFKGIWMCQILLQLEAEVTGYALEPPTDTGLSSLSQMEKRMNSVEGEDIKDLSRLQSVFAQTQPEIVIHMAAQPIVRESYQNQVYTYPKSREIYTQNII